MRMTVAKLWLAEYIQGSLIMVYHVQHKNIVLGKLWYFSDGQTSDNSNFCDLFVRELNVFCISFIKIVCLIKSYYCLFVVYIVSYAYGTRPLSCRIFSVSWKSIQLHSNWNHGTAALKNSASEFFCNILTHVKPCSYKMNAMWYFAVIRR